MLKKIVLLLTVVCGTAVSGMAQTMKEVFLTMPDSVMPLLSKDNRADFVDFLANKMQAKVKNVYEENAYMDTLTADYTCIRPTPSSSIALKLLPLTDSTKVICMVHTFRADAADSKVSFYDTKWRLLDEQDFLAFPVTTDFFATKDADSLSTLSRVLDAPMVVASLSPRTTDLTFTFDDSYLSQEDKKLVDGRFHRTLVKKWEKGRFISK